MTTPRPAWRGLLLAALGLALVACGDSGGPGTGDADGDGGGETGGGFDDHTVGGFDAPDDFFAYHDVGEIPVQSKFVLSDFSTASGGPAFFMSSTFYSLHDEWYWFRLLNGESVPGADTDPAVGYTFETIEAVYGEFDGMPPGSMPLDLTWVQDGARLYSPRFYELGLYEEPRALGLGSVLWHPANPDRVVPDELWLFELEYLDDPDEARVGVFFERLAAVLPPEVGPQLRWLARSPAQEATAAAIDAGLGPYAGRTLTYADLVVAGEIEGYNPGIVAGRIRRLDKGELGAASVGPTDIVVLAEVPDYLPPVAGIVTAVPQTPLAHLNLLAKSRGTPNAYVAGVFDNEALVDWAYYSKPAILQVTEDSVTWQAITKAEYDAYLELLGKADLTIPSVDIDSLPATVDLGSGGLADITGLVPSIGGKSAGFVAFNDFPDITTPPTPLAITIRPYAEHISVYRPTIEALLEDPDFAGDARARFLVLEGEEDFVTEHAGDASALEWLAGFLETHHDQTFLGSLVALGGLKRGLRDWALDAELEAELVATLTSHFAALGPMQGLRFRSSSTAEDVQGFNGAGLYDSNTGFLNPELQPTDKLKKRDVAWALRKTWASYWSFEAFEERRVAGIDHLSGNMGVLVHPRFDDPLELANGVITFWLAREPTGIERSMIVNVQDGATSVTNPDPTDPTTPEIDEVSQVGAGALTVARVQASSLVPAGEVVLSDAQLEQLFAWTSGLTDAWLDQGNSALPAPQARSTLILDFEFKHMDEGWPALASGDLEPARLVLKQVRTLDNPLLGTEEVLAMPVPRDVLEQLHAATRRTCTAVGGPTVEATLFWTDPAKTWAIHHETIPFVASVLVSVPGGAPAADLPAGWLGQADHTGFAATAASEEGPWSLTVDFAEASELQALEVTDGGSWSLTTASGVATGDGVSCTDESLLVSGAQYLQTLLAGE